MLWPFSLLAFQTCLKTSCSCLKQVVCAALPFALQNWVLYPVLQGKRQGSAKTTFFFFLTSYLLLMSIARQKKKLAKQGKQQVYLL